MIRSKASLTAAALALVLVVGVALAIAHVGISIHITLGGGASGEAQTARVAVSAIGPARASTPLFPDATGDVTIRITNLNVRPVTVTGLVLPPASDFARGFTSPAMVKARVGCDAENSGVTWEGATAKGDNADALTLPVVVGARSSLVATLTAAAFMELSAPPSCEGAYFAMPSPTGVTAFAGGEPTPSPVIDALAPRCPPPGPPPGYPAGPPPGYPPGPPPGQSPNPGPPGPRTPPPRGSAGCGPPPAFTPPGPYRGAIPEWSAPTRKACGRRGCR